MKIPKQDREILKARLEKLIRECGEECDCCVYDRRLIKKLEKNKDFSKDEIISLATRRSHTHEEKEIQKIIKRWKEGKEAYTEEEEIAACAVRLAKVLLCSAKTLDLLGKIEENAK